MKQKTFLLFMVLAGLVVLGCTTTSPEPKTTLTIENQTGLDLELVYWGDVSFNTTQIWDEAYQEYYDGLPNGESCTKEVSPGVHNIEFCVVNDPNSYYISDIEVQKGEQKVYVIP
ncbi:hypothetical protein [Thermospira aquatica]|uniref:Lipoprotein n=1 Tax=Thermospira aquatica TaxID=2828656 RepID=A0AAX3BDX9_9SPIR|nr:hypothetical protein [Thermospira aquatica]URA10451.1 hypothetical protein KDW03_01215 [Thermospira aquatica]